MNIDTIFNPQHLKLVKVYKQSSTHEVSGASANGNVNSSYFLNNYYIYVINFNGEIINRRYNEFELLHQILKKLFPTDLLPSIPKKETLMDIVKQQANNSIDITSKTLASGYSNLLHLKDSILSYTTASQSLSHDERDLEDAEKLLNSCDTKSFKFNTPKAHMLNDIDMSGVTDKDIKLIRHRCIFFQDFLNELINNRTIYNENNILKEFLNGKNVNFLDFIKSYSLINQTLLSNDVLRLNPSDPLGTEDFYKYLPLPSVTGRGSLPKVANMNNQNGKNVLGEDGQEEDDDDDEVLESDDSDYENGFSESGSDYGFLRRVSDRRISEPIPRFSRTPSFSKSLQATNANGRNSNDSKRPQISNKEVDLIAYLEKNTENFQKSDKLVKEYKKKVVSKMLKNIKKLSKDVNTFKMVQESFVDSLQAYSLFDSSLPSYEFTQMITLDKVVDDLCGQLYYNCLETMKELDALNDSCLQLIKFGKDKVKQKELLKILIDNETLNLEHLQKKIELDIDASDNSQDAPKDDLSTTAAENNVETITESSKNTVEPNSAYPVQGVSAKFSPFIKRLSSLTSIVKAKYTHSMQPTKVELEAKVSQLEEILLNLEKNESCINEDIMFILKQVYGKDIDLFIKKIDEEMLRIIKIISEAMHIYSTRSLAIWQQISNSYPK